MLEILHGVNVDWMGRRRIAFAVSALCILIALGSLIVRGGPRYGVDFTGGSIVEIQVTPAPHADQVRAAVDHAGFQGSEIQALSKPGQFLIRVDAGPGHANPAKRIADAIQTLHPGSKAEILRVDTVGPRVGNELKGAAIKAILLAMGMILIYVGIRYDWRYSLGAIAALFHDIFITIGALSITNKEITLTVVAALLTIAGFSINDTIVVFDRIRERSKTMRRESPEKVMNVAINETLSRTIITSFTVFLTVLALYTLGGEVIHDFSFAMLVGVVFGTYSSVYVASGLALEVQLWLERAGVRHGKK